MPLLITFVLLVIVLNIFIARSGKAKKPFEALEEENRLANTARKHDIPEDLYLKPDKGILPEAQYAQSAPQAVARAYKTVLSKIDKPMLRLPEGMDNNKIKLTYGVANFEIITSHEENYNTFIRALINWGTELFKAEMYEEAKTVLNESIRLKSDLSLSYTTLFDVLKITNDTQGIKELKKIVSDDEFLSNNKTAKEKIIRYIS